MRIALVIEYDGTAYCGWQVQKNGESVQGVIERAILKATGKAVRLVGSGRTDSGVHALGQVAHFDIDSKVPAESFAPMLNALLPCDVLILKSIQVEKTFNARFSAKKKTYRYRCYSSRYARPLQKRYAVNVPQGYDLALMQQAARLIEGEHDFKCFSASGSSVKNTTRTVYRLEIFEKDGDLIFEICGNGFLYNMVRSVVGTLLKVGYGKMTTAELSKAMTENLRSAVGKTMPACGLCLVSVEYDGVAI